MLTIPDRCETCRFWAKTEGDYHGYGICRRYPPKANHHGQTPGAETLADWWCGEFKPLQAATGSLELPGPQSIEDAVYRSRS